MIAPTYRLIIWTALVILPLSIPTVTTGLVFQLYLILILLYAILISLDAYLVTGRFDGISLELPEVIRMSKGRKAEISLLIKNEKKKVRRA